MDRRWKAIGLVLVIVVVAVPVLAFLSAAILAKALTPLQEICNNPSSWINKEVLVEGRLYVYVHFGFIYQGVKSGPDYILVDNTNTFSLNGTTMPYTMPISSNGITMPISWSMENVPSVENGTYYGPYVQVILYGVVKNTTAGDLGIFWPALYILTLNFIVV